jgi:hypothetical protein
VSRHASLTIRSSHNEDGTIQTLDVYVPVGRPISVPD